MSYYKPSFSQTVAMSRGSGRGFASPRGGSSYRGSSGRGSSWGDRGGSRGGFSSNRGGRFSSSWNSSNASSFDSRSRYPSSSGAGGERYSSNSRPRPDESSYRRSYRSDAQNNSYSSRDASTHRSPDRKRMRNERKAQSDLLNGDKHGSDKEPPSPTEEDLENFMTLDSVGDVDEEEVEGSKSSKGQMEEGGELRNKSKESINVGAEHVKKIEVHYCDLCRIYLSRYDSPDRAIKKHCRGRMHLQRYVRYKEDNDLRRQAERIHRKTQEAKEAKEKEKDKSKKEEKDKTDEKDGEENKDKEDKNEEDGGDDKMWADVDKDLGEILAEVNKEGGNKSSDEDEDSRPDGERYDRFGYSDKGENKDDKKVEGVEKETEENDNEEKEEEEGNNEGEDDGKNEEEEEEEEEEEKEEPESESAK